MSTVSDRILVVECDLDSVYLVSPDAAIHVREGHEAEDTGREVERLVREGKITIIRGVGHE